MNIRKLTIRKTGDYRELAPLFAAAGLENTERVPEGFRFGFAAEDENGALAGGAALVKAGNQYVLHDIAVTEALRGKGVGRRLLCSVMAAFQDMGAERVCLAAKAPAFFRNYGFSEIDADEVPGLFHCQECESFGTKCTPEFMVMELTKERLLFVDSCVSTHRSRTRQLCDAWIRRFRKEHPGAVTDIAMAEPGVVQPMDRELILLRNELIQQRDWEAPMFDLARQFRRADYILVGAPYWDCSFPSVLKIYIENIVVADLTFRETEQGYEGLCPCRELTYITTAGGPVGEMDLGYDYIRGVGRMLGIRNFREYRAEGLDIRGADVDGIMAETMEKINHG